MAFNIRHVTNKEVEEWLKANNQHYRNQTYQRAIMRHDALIEAIGQITSIDDVKAALVHLADMRNPRSPSNRE